jgi:phenylacetate-CoA ligase
MLADSQWHSPERIEEYQLARLRHLTLFASRRTAYGRQHFDFERVAKSAGLSEALRHLPILTRERLRDEPASLKPDAVPKGHKAVTELSSSGSTGLVVKLSAGKPWLRWQSALGLRSHLWGGSRFRRAIGIIRRRPPGDAMYPEGKSARRWGPVAGIPFPTGPAYLLNAYTSLDEQWEWLRRIRPDYLLVVPSVLRNFAGRADAAELDLKGIRTIGEVVDDDLRARVRDSFGVRIHDLYSSEECGTLAIQCPEAGVYHVQSEALIVEVLNDAGEPCCPGEIGRVVATPLYNFATPLIRYELNDYAEAGGSCSCGRGLPVIRRIMGRRRNLLTTPDGRKHWPAMRSIHHIVPIREHQYRQIAPDVIEVWLATAAPVTEEQEHKMREALRKGLIGGQPAPFEFRFRYVSEFPRNPNGKHEEFVSLIA